jgi:hypothetical protein
LTTVNCATSTMVEFGGLTNVNPRRAAWRTMRTS